MAPSRVKPTSVRPARTEKLHYKGLAAGNRFTPNITHHSVQTDDGTVKTFTDFGLKDSVTVLVIAPSHETGRFGVLVFEELKFATMSLMPTTVSGYMDGSDKGSRLAAAKRKLQAELGINADDWDEECWIDLGVTRAYPNSLCAQQYGYALFIPEIPEISEKKQVWVADLCPRGLDDTATREVTDGFGPLRLFAREAMIWLGQEGLIDWFGNPTPKAAHLFA